MPEPCKPARGRRPHVTIVMAICRGQDYLGEQLRSLSAQTLAPARVLASDDAPGDGTGAVFTAHGAADASGCLWELTDGPGRGLTANFLHLLSQVRPEGTGYIALSDQDDIWLPGKLEAAVGLLAPHGARPALAGSRSWEWFPGEGGRRQLSRAVPEPYDFSHALAQNYAGGNTMVLNRAALALVQRALPGLPEPAVHDWWIYQLVAGAGGAVMLDPEPRLLYRQHGGNQIGANASLGSKLNRFRAMLGGTYRHWMGRNIAALQSCRHLLTPAARRLLEQVADGRDGPLAARLALLRETGLHRKGRLNQTSLWLAAALGKL